MTPITTFERTISRNWDIDYLNECIEQAAFEEPPDEMTTEQAEAEMA